MVSKTARSQKKKKKSAQEAVQAGKGKSAGASVSAIHRGKKLRRGATLSEVASTKNVSAGKLIEIIRKGIDYSLLEKLQEDLDLSTGEMGEVIDIAPRTLSRRRKEGRLAKDESDRVVRIGRLWEKALDVFNGNEERARRWFKAPAFSLGNKTPLEFADTEPGDYAIDIYDPISQLPDGGFSYPLATFGLQVLDSRDR